MKYIDTHTHYNDEVYNKNLNEILNKVKSSDVDKIINIGYSIDASKECIKLSEKYDYIYTAIGIHPENVDDNAEDIEKLYKENINKKIVAIGEIGLDYHYTKENKERQKELFVQQIKIAEKLNLPIIVHSRDAALDTYNIIKDNVKVDTKLLFHCFAPTDDLVKLVIERGYFVAFGGNITYPRNESFKEYINEIPLEQIVIETDCPYLAPVPVRGSINDSSNLVYICKKLAEFRNMNEEEVANTVYNNACRFFSI